MNSDDLNLNFHDQYFNVGLASLLGRINVGTLVYYGLFTRRLSFGNSNLFTIWPEGKFFIIVCIQYIK